MDIAIRGLVFIRDGRRVLDIPELDIATGSVTALLGANGAGKTSLLRILAGLEPPTAGDVQIGTAASPRERSLATALTFPEPVFLRGTVRRNLLLGLSLRGVSANEAESRLRRAAEETDLTALLDRPARALSAGESQRVSLARALALEAPVLLLDEPLAGVDRRTRQGLLRDLPRLIRSRGATTLVVTHDREEAFRLADRLAVMVNGQVVRNGPAEEVYQDPGSAAVAELLGYVVLDLAGEPVAVPPDGFRLAPGSGVELTLNVSDVAVVAGHRHVVGGIGAVQVEFRLRGDDLAPQPGARVAGGLDEVRLLTGSLVVGSGSLVSRRMTHDSRPMTHDQ
jgi:ABC-type sugar transport system ATPase subunit